jgi:protocatechuate 3,4-dioxygenase beta subunit
MRRIILFVVLLALAASLLAQNAGISQSACRIEGSVVDVVTGQPLRGAQVFARGMPMSGAVAGQVGSTTTDANGEFRLDNLAPGRYMVRASHSGYVARGRRGAGMAPQMLSLAPGQHVDGVVLSLTPGGAINGHITDEEGRFLAGVSVELMRYSYTEGKREFDTVANVSADAAGEYRMVGLAPGTYYLRATSPARKQTKAGSDKAYVPLYYPRAFDQAGAAALEVRAGEELGGIDISFTPVHTVRITGQVIDARTALPSQSAEVTLLSDQGNTSFPPGEVSADAKGGFEFRGVPPGSYILAAQSSSGKGKQEGKLVWGRIPVEVADVNVTGVKLSVGPGVEVSGRIRVEGKTGLDLGKLAGVLEPREGSALANLMPEVENAPVKPDGTFVFRDVPEGNYELDFSALPAGFYLKASGETDVLETGIAVGRGHGIPLLELTVSHAAATITGTVSNDDQPAAGVPVALVPDAPRQHQRRFYKTSVSDKLGRFALRGIAPGDYRLFALDQVDRDALLNPDFLRQYEDRGQAVHVEENSQANVQLEVIATGEAAQ